MVEKTPHLSDLFKSGQLVKVQVADPEDPERDIDLELWFQRPTAVQQQEALTKARAKQARLQEKVSDRDSDEFLSIKQSVSELNTIDDLVEALYAFEEGELRQEAYNEVLYNKDVGSDWGEEGEIYLDLLGGIRDRFEEIVGEGVDDESMKAVDEDEEIKNLQAVQEKFESEVEAQLEQKATVKRAALANGTAEDLREALIKKLIGVEGGMAWMQEYRIRMLYYTVRYPDNHKKLYFKNPDDIWDLPDSVRDQLQNLWDETDQDLSDLKNSLSLLRSSV